MIDIKKYRKSEYQVSSIFIDRWSPRAMSGQEITNDELMSLFEAAKWAPSSYNNQSWRFIYAKRNTKYWNKFFNLMVEFNQSWTSNAAALVVIISKKTFDHNGNPTRTHSFYTGAAWQNLALQGSLLGLVVHGMEGFDYEKARKELNVPDDYQIEAMAAIGKPGNIEGISKELQEREIPSNRKNVSEIVFEGIFSVK